MTIAAQERRIWIRALGNRQRENESLGFDEATHHVEERACLAVVNWRRFRIGLPSIASGCLQYTEGVPALGSANHDAMEAWRLECAEMTELVLGYK